MNIVDKDIKKGDEDQPYDNLKNTNLQMIEPCIYLLPCGICDKNQQMCSQYEVIE